MLIRDKHLVVAFESRKLNETEHRARIGYGRSSAKKETSGVSRNLRNGCPSLPPFTLKRGVKDI